MFTNFYIFIINKKVSPGYSRPGAYPVLRHRGSIEVSLCTTPRRSPLLCTSSNSCFGRAPGSPPPCGQSQGSESTNLSPSYDGPCRRPTLYPMTSLKAVPSRPLPSLKHFNSTSRSLERVFLIPWTVTPSSFGLMRFKRSRRMPA